MSGFFYSFALVFTAVYACVRGGREGRAIFMIIAILFALSWILSAAVTDPGQRVMASLAIDCVSLILKTGLALSSSRRWPIIVAAFQVNLVCSQVAILIAPGFRTEFHHAMATVWALPTLGVIALGIYLDRRHDILGARRQERRNGKLAISLPAEG